MTMLASEVFRCGNCKRKSEHTVMRTSNMLCEPDLDARPGEDYRSTMSMWIQRCPHCDYCAPDLTERLFDSNIIRSNRYCTALARDDVPELATRFMAAAIISGSRNPSKTAHSILAAAWVCDDAGSDWQAVNLRRRAAKWFASLKPFTDDEQGFQNGSILVDILRRCGQFDDAMKECTKLLNHHQCPDNIVKLLNIQTRLIYAQDVDAHAVPERR